MAASTAAQNPHTNIWSGAVDPDLTFTPPCGPITGWRDGDVIRATSIPYAKADRFAKPKPMAPWADPLAATEWAPACPQPHVPALDVILGTTFGTIPGSEDCLRLSVTRPAQRKPGERLPVMVYIHGGSYVTGAGDLAIFDPARLVAEQQVIVVAVTYRLGVFGFLGAEGGRPPNLGLLDQIEAFRWVRANIAGFGGDPQQVTAFGQSAGGDAIGHLMAVDEAPELFDRAIIQSAPWGISRGRQAMNQAMYAATLATDAKASMDEWIETGVHASLAARRHGLRSGMPFGVQPGCAPIPPEDELDEHLDAHAPKIPVLIGHTAEEVRFLLPRVESLRRLLTIPLLGPAVRTPLVALMTWVVYGRGSRHFARRHARAGGQAHHYVLEWSAHGSEYGSAHTIDLPLLLGNQEAWAPAALLSGANWDEIDSRGYQLRSLWAEFARGTELGNRGRLRGLLRYRRI